ncbi:hypothetical protein ACI3EY_16720 [Ornithinimicrobium sp. LYQ92]|uniref:hypothetical protein n=1 Tax=Serinicoccus sp. LYQ92 TaxID=3378798 RepID=UPI0038527E85
MSAADVKEYRRRIEALEADWNMERDRRQAAEAALARVEALAAAFEAPGVGYRGVALAIREAMGGTP